MIKHYIIDGNNLIGKIRDVWKLQKKNPQDSREKLALMLDRYFHNKNVKVSLHFDGFAGDAIKTSKLTLFYSNGKTADKFIKDEIDNVNNPRVVALISSDHNLMEFAKVNSCTILKSEIFAKNLFPEKIDTEEEKIKSIKNEDIKKLFGL